MFINTLSWLYFCFCANTNITPSQVETTKFNFFKNNLDLNQTRNTGLDERVSIMSDIIQDTEINYELKIFKKTLLICTFNLIILISMIINISLFKIIP